MLNTLPMPLEKLSLNHRSLLVPLLKEARTFISEYSFPNLYLFRDTHEHAILREGDSVFVTGKAYDGSRYVFPADGIRAHDLPLLEVLLTRYDHIFPVAEEWLDFFDKRRFRVDFLEGDSDYLYTLESLATYKGAHLHSKKNLLNQVLALYVPRAVPLIPGIMADAQIILVQCYINKFTFSFTYRPTMS